MTTWHACIVHWRSPLPELRRAAEALAAQDPPCAELTVLVGSDDGSVAPAVEQLLAGLPLPLRVLSDPDNPGFAGGQNRLVAEAFARGADVAVVHNPDLALRPGAMAEVLAVRATWPGPALLSPMLELADDEGRPTGQVDSLGSLWTWDGRHLDRGQGQPLPPARRSPEVVPGLTGACIVVPRETYDRIVGASGELFDADFFAYREDAELTFRAGLLGVANLVVPAATGLHQRRQRGVARGNPHTDRLSVRNRFLLAAKYGRRRPGRGAGPWVRDVAVVLGVLLRERSSAPGLAEAWRLRGHMREKGDRVLRAAAGRAGSLP